MIGRITAAAKAEAEAEVAAHRLIYHISRERLQPKILQNLRLRNLSRRYASLGHAEVVSSERVSTASVTTSTSEPRLAQWLPSSRGCVLPYRHREAM